jgi:PhoH-like ATPase
VVYPNQFLFVKSDINEKKTVLLRKGRNGFFKKCEKLNAWGLKPRNKEQILSLDLLFDKSVPVVSLIGRAGSGKTLLALGAGLEQTINKKVYDRIIVTKPVHSVGKDIGYLPGTMEEKMSPWIAPIKDNLKFLFKNDKMTLEMYFDNGIIEVEAMSFIRGRSITNSYIIIDEAQNLTHHEIKTILTRVGENTKIILTGDIEQIDNVFINSTTNGLTYVVEKFKDQDISGHVTLLKGERSEVATVSANIL